MSSGVSGPAVEFDAVGRSFGSLAALSAASWRAMPGQVTCVLGPNGAGKSTSIDIAAGLQRADQGQVRVLGEDPWLASADHRARVGVMLQDSGLPQAARPTALLGHLSRFYAAPWPPGELCDLLGITDFGSTPVRRLSGGQRKRLALAAALIGRGDVLFLDEPTAGLDPHARRATYRIIRDVAGADTAVVVSTHAFEEAELLADHVVILSGGKVVGAGTVAEICCGRTLEERYFALTGDEAR